ncbi:hypothetical protein ACN267_31315 [Micromonospora sp. WMMD734]|uniref:hypothetical protein n=1 Tax=Micromonospora sp. WMMD734 TaxID=3404129 RepID=UPI003B92DD03
MKLHAGGIHRRLVLTTRRFRAIRDLLVAADRMRDRWAEGDEAVRRELWTNLHKRADDLRDSMA